MRRRFCALFADTENYRERDRERNTYIDTDKERHREKKEKKPTTSHRLQEEN